MTGTGRFIVFEGLDGAGSTTQLNLLAAWLDGQGIAVELTREPSSGPIGSVVRQALEKRVVLDQTTLALAFAADRADHLHNPQHGVLARVQSGRWVLSDRYVLSSLAYQCSEANDRDWLATINRSAPPPDLTVFVDTPVEQCLDRLRKRSTTRDLFEDEAELRRVDANYRAILGHAALTGPVLAIDGGGAADEVFAALLKQFRAWLEGTGVELRGGG